MDYVAEYWQQIEAGEVVVCRKTRAIYGRLVAEAEADTGRWVWLPSKGESAISFIETFCYHSKGQWAGTPVRLELWEKAFIQTLFGWKDRDTGENRYVEALLSMGRKGGKSLVGSCTLLFLWFTSKQADCYTVATKLDQAMIVWENCLHCIEASPLLAKRVKKRRADLYLPATKSKLKALGRASNTLDGLLSKACVIDECHALVGANGKNLVEVMRQSMSATRDPLLLITTTAGTQSQGVYMEIYQLATNILDGTITGGAADRFLPVIYELDEADEWREKPNAEGYTQDGKRSAWYKANPSLEPQGHVKKLDFLIAECERAEANPVDLPGILCKDFNLPSSSQNAWLQLHEIRNDDTFDLRECAGKWAIGSVDLSKAGDLTCASILMRDGNRWLCNQCYFIPSDNLKERIEHDKIPYDRWIQQGLVRTCEGGVIRTEDVTEWFVEIVRKYDISIHSVWYDAWSATRWVDEMKSIGFRMVPVHQGAKTLSLPLDHLENALRKRQIVYNEASTGPNECLLWCLTNCATTCDRNGNRLLCKALSPRHRIDGAASLLDCWVGVISSPDFEQL